MGFEYDDYEIWLLTGSQHLYGNKVLKNVNKHSKEIAEYYSQTEKIPVKVVQQNVLTSHSEIKKLTLKANADEKCIGLITWMHTFSPARMWISGLKSLQKPFLHLHTQYNRDIPWSEIDMEYMNTNQSAHGGREFGHIASRMGKERKIVVGHWQDEKVIDKIAVWSRAAAARADLDGARIARFGDNMRDVAVTEGDKVEAEIELGFSVNGYGLGELGEYVDSIKANKIEQLLAEYEEKYFVAPELKKSGKLRDSLREAARIELGMRTFLEEGDFKAFTTNFENLHGLKQLPGLAAQRLMAEGYGFGAEGDWKTAALVRALKTMGKGLDGGTSFMEHYTYHLDPENTMVLGAHMLEVCETIAADNPSLEIHPLDIGGKDDPVRLVFDTESGPGLNASLIDLGNRFRMILNEVQVIAPKKEMPRLPVARVFWKPEPDLETAVHSWILAGGAHHTAFTMSLKEEFLKDFSRMLGIEYVKIDKNTNVDELEKELRLNNLYYS